MQKRILVIGPSAIEMQLSVLQIPLAGETSTEHGERATLPGGRGCISALAFSKLGAHPLLCTVIGEDRHGESLSALFRAAKLDTRFVHKRKDMLTPFKLTIKEQNGVSRATYYPGAYTAVSEDLIESGFVSYPDGVYSQLDLHIPLLASATATAREQGVPFFLDGKGADSSTHFSYLSEVEVFSPNIQETFNITKILPSTTDTCLRACVKLQQKVKAKYYVIKLGERGVFIYDGKYCSLVTPHRPDLPQSPYAEDALSSALAYAYLQTGNIEFSAKFGVAAMSYCCEKGISYSAFPTEDEVIAYCKQNGIKF